MADINLLQQRKLGFFSEERLLLIARIGAVVSVVLVLSLSILFFLLSKDPAAAQQDVDKAQTLAQLTLLHSKTAKYLILIDRTTKIQQLEGKRIALGQTISDLVKEVPAEVTITTFAIDRKTYSLSILSTNVSLLGKIVDNFSNLVSSGKVIKDVTVQGIISDEKGQNYVLTLSGDLL